MDSEMIFVKAHPFAKNAAKEITTHVFEFIEWLHNSESVDWDWLTDLPTQKTDYFLKGEMVTLNELYLYWLHNIKQQ